MPFQIYIFGYAVKIHFVLSLRTVPTLDGTKEILKPFCISLFVSEYFMEISVSNQLTSMALKLVKEKGVDKQFYLLSVFLISDEKDQI